MNKDDTWISRVGSNLKKNMQRSSVAAYENACDLLEDAIILLTNGRYSRATAIAILAEEEFSKAFILVICSENKRWDSEIYKSLIKHEYKQAFFQGIFQYFDWFKKNHSRVVAMNKFSFVPSTAAMLPNKNEWDGWIKHIKKSTIKKRQKERFKQRLFYVDIDKDATISSSPMKAKCSDADAKEKIEAVKELKETLDMVLLNLVQGFKKKNLGKFKVRRTFSLQ